MKLTRIATGIIAVALMALVVNDAVGQDEGRRRGGDRGGERGGPGGFRGGPGGFGGGGFGGGRGGPGGGQTQDPTMQLLRVEAVREELELLPDQEDALRKVEENARSGFQRPDFDFRNASEEERNAFFEKMREQLRERGEEMQAQLEEVLLPEQFERLKQLGVQVMGMRALSLERVAKELGISDKQKEELADVTASVTANVQEEVRAMMSSGDFDREAMRSKIEEIREGVESKVMDVLTSDQRKKFEEMKGEPFDLPEGALGRGGPGGGRGGFGGGRGGPGGGRGFGGGRGGPGGGRGGPDGGGRGGDRQRPSFE